jgi:hypothetical protein
MIQDFFNGYADGRTEQGCRNTLEERLGEISNDEFGIGSLGGSFE